MKEKLKKIKNNKKGASIAIALMLFLCCTIVSAIVISAATVIAGRMAELKQQEQTYLITSSVTDLIMKDINGLELTFIKQDNGNYTYTKQRSGGEKITQVNMADIIAESYIDKFTTGNTEGLTTTFSGERDGKRYKLTADIIPGDEELEMVFKGLQADSGIYASTSAYNVVFVAKLAFSEVSEKEARIWFMEAKLKPENNGH